MLNKYMWQRLKTSVLLDHPRLKVLEDDVRLPNGEVIQYLRFADSNDSVCLVCIKDGKVLIQQEYSYPPAAMLYQFPGGAIEPGETPQTAAKRELLEESGVKARRLTRLGFFYRNNRRESGRMHVFLADDSTEGLETKPDAEEFIKSGWLALPQFKRMISDGKITNFSMLAAWTLYENRHK
jgi:ADP-ribose pyrophosphatase